MIEFTKINAQTVRHISGYEVYPDGKEYIVYKNKDIIYKVYKQYGWDIDNMTPIKYKTQE